MTAEELYSQVARLGFEDGIEDEEMFYQAANRALSEIAALRPRVKSCTINHRVLPSLLCGDFFSPIDVDGELRFTAQGVRAYYIEADGSGSICFYDGQQIVHNVELDGDGRTFKSYRGFVKDEYGNPTDRMLTVCISGEYAFQIRNLALYGRIWSEQEDAIPAFTPYIAYDIAELAPDFLTLASQPLNEATRETLHDDYKIERDHVVYLPRNYPGVYDVNYVSARNPIVKASEDGTGNGKIDLDPDLIELLPLLCASYVWLDDEPQKSEYYRYLYELQSAKIIRSKTTFAPVIMKSKYNW